MVVLGAGPVGLSAARSAWLMGAGRVIVVDHLEYRLEMTRSFALAETCNFAEHVSSSKLDGCIKPLITVHDS